MNGFLRQEVILLTGAKSGDLSYWDSTGLVAPSKFGNPKHPTVIYSSEQILQIKLIYELKERFSLQVIRGIVEFLGRLDSQNLQLIAKQCDLVLVDSHPYLISSPEELGAFLLKMADGLSVTVINLGKVNELLGSVVKTGESKILDFHKRIKGTVLEAS